MRLPLTFTALALIGLSSSLSATTTTSNNDWQAASSQQQFTERSQQVAKASSGVIKRPSNATHSAQGSPAVKKLKRTSQQQIHPDFWVYEAWVSYQHDLDYDGYFSSFTLEFDADTNYVSRELYARLYLGRGENFYEYHTTDIFRIFGDAQNDSLVVDSELISGFPSYDYEVLIELYDAHNNQLVASFDGYNDADLTLVSLESKDYEEQKVIVISSESGGSLGGVSLLGLLTLLALRRKKPAS